MITNLNAVVQGKEAKGFEPLPAGVYDAVVDTIKPWVAKEFKDALINDRDEEGFVIRDENNKTVKVKADFTAYSSDIVLKITSGDYEGRLIFANITTHPDVSFLLDQFIYATVNSCVLAELPEKALGLPVRVNVGVREYVKTVTDPNTALDKEEKRVTNQVKGFYKTNITNDLGI